DRKVLYELVQLGDHHAGDATVAVRRRGLADDLPELVQFPKRHVLPAIPEQAVDCRGSPFMDVWIETLGPCHRHDVIGGIAVLPGRTQAPALVCGPVPAAALGLLGIGSASRPAHA